jgi:protein-tyrosine phosphatase
VRSTRRRERVLVSDATPAAPAPAGISDPYRVCFVCTGNICRSPMAEVVLRSMAVSALPPGDRLTVSSAGTGNWHEGEPMDPRARRALAAAGYRDHGHVARQFRTASVPKLDLIVALDRRHLQTVRGMASARQIPGAEARTVLLRQFDRSAGGALDVPDPYYGDDSAFDECLAMVEAGCRGLMAAICDTLDGAYPRHR